MITIFFAAMLMQGFSTPDGKPLYTWGQCQAYTREAQSQEENIWQLPEVYVQPQGKPLKPILRFWRIRMKGMDHGEGNWHLYNEEDKKFLTDTARYAIIEWTLVEGRLPI